MNGAAFRLAGPLASAVFLLAAAAQGQRPTPSWQRPRPPLEYQNVPFTAELIRDDDRRFLLAALEWRLEGGVRLTSRDPAIYSIAWFDGTIGTGKLGDGRAIVILPHAFGSAPVTEIRTARTPELAGGYPGRNGLTAQAPSHPDIPGYRYVMSENLFGVRGYLGLWQRIRGPDETLVVNFRPALDNRREGGSDAATYRIVGRLPLRLNSLFVNWPLHNLSRDVYITSEARVGRPLYILYYRWMHCPLLRVVNCDHDNAASR